MSGSTDKEHTRTVAFCPHCGNRATQNLIHVQHFLACGFRLDGTREEHEYLSAYYVAVCETCHEILLYLDEFNDFAEQSFSNALLVWPDRGTVHRSVPDSVRHCYEEAARIREVAPNAFAGQIRRALEAICDDRSVTQGGLEKRLQQLVDRGEMPQVLAEIAHVLRHQGNIGVHASEKSVKPGHVRIIDDLFRTILDYVYVAPSKLNEFRTQLNP